MFRRFLSSLRDIAGSCVERVGIIFIYQPVANMWLQFFEALRCVREELCWSDWKSFQRKIWLQHIHHQQSWLEAAEKGPSDCLLRLSGPFWVPQGRRCVWGIKRPFRLFIIPPRLALGYKPGKLSMCSFSLCLSLYCLSGLAHPGCGVKNSQNLDRCGSQIGLEA